MRAEVEVVRLSPGCAEQGGRPKITPGRAYQSVATGYEAVLNNTQYQGVLASPDVSIVTLNSVVVTVAPPVTPSPGPQPLPTTP